MNRREFVQTASASVLTSALPATAFSVTVAAPVAYVWMGQILLDYSGTQQAYVPPVGYSPLLPPASKCEAGSIF